MERSNRRPSGLGERKWRTLSPAQGSTANKACRLPTVWTRPRVRASRRSASIRSAPNHHQPSRVVAPRVWAATTAIEFSSRASVLRLGPVSNRRTQAASLTRDVHNVLTFHKEALGQRPTGSVRALDRPAPARATPWRRSASGVAGPHGREPARAEQLLLVVDDLDGRRQIVVIHPDDDVVVVGPAALHVTPPVLVPMGAGVAGAQRRGRPLTLPLTSLPCSGTLRPCPKGGPDVVEPGG